MVNLILASHGDLSKGILNSTMMITGDLHKNVETFSLYPGENPLDYANELKNRIMRTKDTWIIIADIQGGSVHTALLQLTTLDNVIVFSGMNLNLVLGMKIYQKIIFVRLLMKLERELHVKNRWKYNLKMSFRRKEGL